MISVFSSVKSFVFKNSEVSIDDRVFQLHYRVTVSFLTIFFILASSNQYFGDPISCMPAAKDLLPIPIINTYCWIQSTFISISSLNKKVGEEIPHPGIARALDEGDKKYLKYYQWVCFVLLFQALLFYLPRYIWKTLEGGKITNIIMQLNLPVMADDEKTRKQQLLVSYLVKSKGTHNFYAYEYFFCVFLNLINVVGQMFFINQFLEGEFTTYGLDVIRFVNTDSEDRVDPMIKVFPRVSKCIFRVFGPSGGVQTYDILCVLPLNIVNEKIFIFLWFWFVLLAAVTGLSVILATAALLIPSFRYVVLCRTLPTVSRGKMEEIVHNSNVGDCLLLYFVSVNIDSIHINDVMIELFDKWSTSRRGSYV